MGGRVDKSVRATIGVAMVSVGAVGSLPLGVAIALAASGLLVLGSILPRFTEPSFHIEIGSGPPFDIECIADDQDVKVFDLAKPDEVTVYMTRIRITETRGRWGEDVSVTVSDVVPPSRHGPAEHLAWWDRDDTREIHRIEPWHSRFAVLHRYYRHKTDPSKNGYRSIDPDVDDFEATLTVSAAGKPKESIRIRVEHAKDPQVVRPTVTEVGRPSVRDVQKTRRERVRSRTNTSGRRWWRFRRSRSVEQNT